MDAVSQILDQRGALRGATGRGFVIASVILHFLAIVLLVFAPEWFEREPVSVRYVEVIAVPAAALQPGPKPEPKRTPPVAKPPEPERPEPEPDPPKPAPEDTPVLEEKKPPPKPEPKQAEPVSEAPEPESERTSQPGPQEDPPASEGKTEEAEFAGFDDPEFSLRYSYYLDRLIASIRRQWRRPNVGEGVELIVSFRIVREGNQLTELAVERSSGSRAFDRSGFEAVQNAAPLPPLPQAYRKDSLGVRIIFR